MPFKHGSDRVDSKVENGLCWRLAAFDALDAASLYALLAARVAVFVVEQRCAYQELDGLDIAALHLSAERDGSLVAVARILPPGSRYDQPSIGRVLTLPPLRGTGLGRVLMQHAIAVCRQRWPNQPIRVSAQRHLESFYASLGFSVISEPFDEDGIEHVDMRLEVGRRA
ncbi:MAG: GNAT family N-acetyltransferase [Gammaproteobacteria bacterium HGW-Gammaproteobacteria-8]|nr:MAG: GNAT family N-acetyltransferase [Gammaproteobacteria bacterium HGW-Gammaproteobacteria-8]